MRFLVKTVTLILVTWTMSLAFTLNQELDRAGQFERAGDFESALAIFKNLTVQYPHNTAVIDGLKRNYLRLEQYPDLIALLQQQLAGSPGDEKTVLELGDVYFKSNNRTQAVEFLKNSLALADPSLDLYGKVAQIYGKYREWGQARAIYEWARLKLANPDLFIDEMAAAWLQEKKYKEAVGEYLKYFKGYSEEEYKKIYEKLSLVDKVPDVYAAVSESLALLDAKVKPEQKFYLHKLKADLLLMFGKYHEAFAETKLLEKMSRNNGNLLYEFALWSQQEGLWDLAIQVNSYLAATYPKSPWLADIYYSTAFCRAKLKQYDQSLAIYDTLITRFPKHALVVEAYYQKGEINYLEQSNLDQAMQCYTTIIKKYRQTNRTVDALFRIADCFIAKGDLKEALDVYNQLDRQVKSSPELASQTLYKKAEALFLSQKFDEIRSLLAPLVTDRENLFQNNAIELMMVLEAGTPEELGVFAQALLAEGQKKLDNALDLWKKFAGRFPQSRLADRAAMHAAQALVLLNQPLQAITAYALLAKEKKDGPFTVDARIRIAEIYEQDLKNPTQAVSEYKKIIEEFPDSPRIPMVRKRLRELMKTI